ncbi:MAG: hypothetical protein GXP63_02305 [DPANN group archaeon]|nr:hypothetical protein [DPANN group archaeon]
MAKMMKFELDFSEQRVFCSENTTDPERREMYHQSPESWRRKRGLDIEFPKPTQEQIERARKDYEEFIDIP